jgi:hypothetical protein
LAASEVKAEKALGEHGEEDGPAGGDRLQDRLLDVGVDAAERTGGQVVVEQTGLRGLAVQVWVRVRASVASRLKIDPSNAPFVIDFDQTSSRRAAVAMTGSAQPEPVPPAVDEPGASADRPDRRRAHDALS